MTESKEDMPQGTSLFDLTGKVALVTGASRGIGLAMAKALAAAGADIIGVSASLERSGSEVECAVRRLGRTFTGYTVDFSDRRAVLEFSDHLDALPAPIDILVNNAGTVAREPAATHDLAVWDRVVEVDLSAPFILTQYLGRRMLERRTGKVIFTASLLSFQGGLNVPAYAAAKSGLAGLTRALANEWAPSGVNVNAVVPGYIETGNTQALRDDPLRNTDILRRIPAGRWGRPSDLAGVTIFLASAASDYVHGALIVVDGGWLGR